LCALDKKLFVILQRIAVEASIPGPPLFGMECHVALKDDGVSSVLATSIDLTRIQLVPRKEAQRRENLQGPLGMVWIGTAPSLLQYESSFGPSRTLL